MGFSTPNAQIPWGAAFQASVSEHARSESKMPVAASWYIDKPTLAKSYGG